MGRRITSMTTLTPTATADATNLVDNTYPHIIQGGSATQINRIWEISINGQAASSSSPTFMVLGADSTIGATVGARQSGNNDAPLDSSMAALAAPAVTITAWTTKPQRSASLHLANCSLNAFGGVYFWRANRLEEAFAIVGASVNTGEVSLSAFTGGTPGAIGSHIIYESV